jgi:hypothetical protein
LLELVLLRVVLPLGVRIILLWRLLGPPPKVVLPSGKVDVLLSPWLESGTGGGEGKLASLLRVSSMLGGDWSDWIRSDGSSIKNTSDMPMLGN